MVARASDSVLEKRIRLPLLVRAASATREPNALGGLERHLAGVPSCHAQALAEATAHVWRQQHAGTHEQDREDARRWLDRWGAARCTCEKCQQEGRRST